MPLIQISRQALKFTIQLMAEPPGQISRAPYLIFQQTRSSIKQVVMALYI